MKRGIVILLILLFLATTIGTSPVSVGFGSTLTFGNDFEEIDGGTEMRLSLFLFEASFSTNHRLDRVTTLMAGGLALELWEMVRIGLALGPVVQLSYEEVFFDWRYLDGSYQFISIGSFREAFLNGLINYRAYVEAVLSPVSLGLTYQVPSLNASFANFKEGEFEPVWERGRFGLTLFYWLF